METHLVMLDPFHEVKYYIQVHIVASLPMTQAVKNLPAMQKNSRLIPGSGRSPAERIGNPLQFSCLENPTDRKSQEIGGLLQSVGSQRVRLDITHTIYNHIANEIQTDGPRIAVTTRSHTSTQSPLSQENTLTCENSSPFPLLKPEAVCFSMDLGAREAGFAFLSLLPLVRWYLVSIPRLS